eukprot:CFRG6092T1
MRGSFNTVHDRSSSHALHGKTLLFIRTSGSGRIQHYKHLKSLGVTLWCYDRCVKPAFENVFDEWIVGNVFNESVAIKTVIKYLKDIESKCTVRTCAQTKSITDVAGSVLCKHVDGVLTFDEFGVGIAAALCDLLDLPGIPLSVAKTTRNKFNFRRFCKNAGLPSIPFMKMDDVSDVDAVHDHEHNLTTTGTDPSATSILHSKSTSKYSYVETNNNSNGDRNDYVPTNCKEYVHFPVVFKPCEGGGSQFVQRADSAQELKDLLVRALKVARDHADPHPSFEWVMNYRTRVQSASRATLPDTQSDNEPRTEVGISCGSATNVDANGSTDAQLFMVESLLTGIEVDVDVLVSNGTVSFMSLSTNFSPQTPLYFMEMGGECPSRLPHDAQAKILALVEQIFDAYAQGSQANNINCERVCKRECGCEFNAHTKSCCECERENAVDQFPHVGDLQRSKHVPVVGEYMEHGHPCSGGVQYTKTRHACTSSICKCTSRTSAYNRTRKQAGQNLTEQSKGIYGCFHVEIMYTADGPVPIEVNCRLGGAETHVMVNTAWGVSLSEGAALLACGYDVIDTLSGLQTHAAMQNQYENKVPSVQLNTDKVDIYVHNKIPTYPQSTKNYLNSGNNQKDTILLSVNNSKNRTTDSRRELDSLIGEQYAGHEHQRPLTPLNMVPLHQVSSTNLVPVSSGVIAMQSIPSIVRADAAFVGCDLYYNVGDRVTLPPDGFQYLGWMVVRDTPGYTSEENLTRLLDICTFSVVSEELGTGNVRRDGLVTGRTFGESAGECGECGIANWNDGVSITMGVCVAMSVGMGVAGDQVGASSAPSDGISSAYKRQMRPCCARKYARLQNRCVSLFDQRVRG